MKNKVVGYSTSVKALQIRGLIMLALLTAQFVVGMTLELFIELPDSHPDDAGSFIERTIHSYGWAITNGDAVLMTHVVLASILVLGSLATLGFSIAAKQKTWIIASSFGLVGVWLAFLNGLEFINTNLDNHSMAMAMAFIIAFISYGSGLYFGKQK